MNYSRMLVIVTVIFLSLCANGNEQRDFYTLLDNLRSYVQTDAKDVNEWKLAENIEASLDNLITSSPEKTTELYYDFAKALHGASTSHKHSSLVYRTTKYAQKLAVDSYGPSDLRTLELTYLLAKLHIENRKVKKAKKVLSNAITEFESNYANPQEIELKMRSLLVRLYKSQNQHRQATKHLIALNELSPLGDTPYSESFYWVRNDSVYMPSEVEVEFSIDENGAVQNATVISSTDPSLDDYALYYVSQWLYSPEMKGGLTIASRKNTVILNFGNTPSTYNHEAKVSSSIAMLEQ